MYALKKPSRACTQAVEATADESNEENEAKFEVKLVIWLVALI